MFFGTSVVTGLHDHHCIWSVMQKLKNILGSRKKGAQEPHAAREHRYDSQGNAPSNLKGISLDSSTLPAGLTSYCTVPLFAPVTICISPLPACATVCVLCSVSLQRAQSWCKTSPGVWATPSLTWALKAIPCSFSSLMNRYLYITWPYSVFSVAQMHCSRF